MTELLAESGYDMIGVDNSEEMLGEAMEKRAESGHEILYLEQDMREFELYGTVRAVVSVCDCMNYITELVPSSLPVPGSSVFHLNKLLSQTPHFSSDPQLSPLRPVVRHVLRLRGRYR